MSALALLLAACGGSSSTPTSPDVAPAATDPGTTSPTTSSLPAVYRQFGPAVEVYLDGDRVVLRSADLPDHPSPYYGAGHSLYVAPHAGMVVNPNRILAQDFAFRVPAAPAVATRTTATNLGAIGIATNGVVLFNQYAGPNNQPLDNEVASFDAYHGHPQQTGQYHYHFEPVWLTGANPAALIGVLLDGFPIYGPVDGDGSTPTDLDVCNGHVGATADFPQGQYHYHATAGFPYLSGCYRGTAGTVSN